MLFAVLLAVVLLVIAVTVLPTWRHSRGWGYVPSGSLGLLAMVLVALMLTGHL